MKKYTTKCKPKTGQCLGKAKAARKRWRAKRAATEFEALHARTLQQLME